MDKQVVDDPSADQFDDAAGVFKLLADPTRLRIVWALIHGEHSVNELAAHIGVQPAGVSQHLMKLRLSRVVTTRRDGNRIYYSAGSHHVGRLAEEAMSHAQHLVGAAHHLEAHPTGESA